MKLLKQTTLVLVTVVGVFGSSAFADLKLAIYNGHGAERYLYRDADPMVGLSVQGCSVGTNCQQQQGSDFQRDHGFEIRDNAHGVQSVR